MNSFLHINWPPFHNLSFLGKYFLYEACI
jgi:hypothetical protein